MHFSRNITHSCTHVFRTREKGRKCIVGASKKFLKFGLSSPSARFFALSCKLYGFEIKAARACASLLNFDFLLGFLPLAH